MPFDYYHRLSPRQKQIYQQSDNILEIQLPRLVELHDTVSAIERSLEKEDRIRVQKLSTQLAQEITKQLNIPTLRVKVLARRPSDDWGELHGLYEPAQNGEHALITVWMRTAKRKQVVAFKTYLRTLLHEISHHLDYEYFRLKESFHTEGFYKRENYLFQALINPIKHSTPLQYELSLSDKRSN